MPHFLVQYANGEAHCWGKDIQHAVQRLTLIKSKMEIGSLVRIITDDKKVSYWSGKEFVKYLKKGDKYFTKEANGQ